MRIQECYQKAIKFAGKKHAEINQLIPGTNLPYVVHLSNVSMEVIIAYYNSFNEKFDLDFAVQLALLHDTLEDTETSVEEISSIFGKDIADGVVALTKNDNLLKNEKMNDSLNRIKLSKKEVAIVKLADRITNLQTPPTHWDKSKIESYKNEAAEILNQLNGSNEYLEQRLFIQLKIYEKNL